MFDLVTGFVSKALAVLQFSIYYILQVYLQNLDYGVFIWVFFKRTKLYSNTLKLNRGFRYFRTLIIYIFK